MPSPLRPQPDYLENPHDGSPVEDWLKYAAVEETPEEGEFFEELLGTMHKGGMPSQLQFAQEGGESPTVNVHDVHISPSNDPSDSNDSPNQRLNQDRIVTTPPGLGRNVMSKTHKSDSLEGLAAGLKNVSQQAQTAITNTQQLQQAQSALPKPQVQTNTQPNVNGLQPQQPMQQMPKPGTQPLQQMPMQSGGQTNAQPTLAQAAPVAPTTSTTPQAPAVPPPSVKPSTVTYSTETKTASLGGRAHAAWFQSNPYMTFNFDVMNPMGHYNDMDYNPRPSYFEEGSGDSSFADLHKNPNGNYTRDSFNIGGVTDLLIAPPADSRWTNDPPDLEKIVPLCNGVENVLMKEASISQMIDREMLKVSKKLSTEDNPYIRDYSETRPLNNSITDSINAPQKDPNRPQSDHDEYGSLHQTQPRVRAIGPQGPLSQFDPTGQTADPFIETVAPASADGTRYSLPSYKTKRPQPGLTSFDIIRDH